MWLQPLVTLLLLLASVATRLPRDDHSHSLEHSDGNDMPGMDDGDVLDASENSPSSSVASLVPVAHVGQHHHGMPILEMKLAPEERLYWQNYSTETYFNTPSLSRGSLFLHIGTYVGSFMFLYPLVLVLWNTNHKLYFPALTIHCGLIVFSAISFFVFEASIKDLFPHNAFSVMTTILMITTIGQWGLALIASAYSFLTTTENFGDYSEIDDLHSFSGSPGSTLRGSTSTSSLFELDDLSDHNGHTMTSNDAMRLPQPSSQMSQLFLKFPAFQSLTQKTGKFALFLTSLANWALFGYFLVYLGTGVATYTLYGQGKSMFNLLAHFIKGGVFMVLGFVSLARYCGAFEKKGWAWNHIFIKPTQKKSFWTRWFSPGTWTMEMVESSLILFYGSTNIFLEHLANAGGAWSAKDLQHVSIAFIYIGCGLCGVLLEKKISSWRKAKALESLEKYSDSKSINGIMAANPGFSPNPFPLLTIFWTGYLMSQHEQESQMATAIHLQWGNMFVFACAFRAITYGFFLVAPVNNKTMTKPQMPMSELVVSFCLMAGGLIFMESCTPVVHLMEYYGYSAMFTLNLTLGIVTLLMAWQMSVFSLKDCLMKRGSFRSAV